MTIPVDSKDTFDTPKKEQDDCLRPPSPPLTTVGDVTQASTGEESIPPPLEEIDCCEENSIGQRRTRLQLGRTAGAILLVVVLIGTGRWWVVDQDFRFDGVLLGSPDLQDVISRINESIPLNYLSPEKKRPGYVLAERGAMAQYPVVMIPGFVTSGLEVWAGQECAKNFFRRRLWAAVTGARAFLAERHCWRKHMMLDPISGGDPEGIKIRASQGFEAADYFMGNYWVWSKLVANLADVGYDPNTMTMEAYDWRLSFRMLEKRDGYLTKLRFKIESFHRTTGKKVVIASHSMGALLVHYFFAWVTTSERLGGGGGGYDWVDKHVHAYINIAGSHLGVPKAATALLSGEMSDTAFTGMMGNMAEQFFGRRLRRDLWATWGSLYAMLPKGGSRIWDTGADMCSSRSANDSFCPINGYSPLLTIRNDTSVERVTKKAECTVNTTKPNSLVDRFVANFDSQENHTVESINQFLLQFGAGHGPETAANRDYSLFGQERNSHRIWHDPTRTPLPYAPNLKIYCLYGFGIDTERAYHYRRVEVDETAHEMNESPEPTVILDASVHNDALNTRYGTRFVDGDGSVPLISLGYMCVDAWTRHETKLNPSGIQVVTREYRHESEFCVDDPMRGGPGSAEHVDILGNFNMTEDFIRIVTNFEMNVVDHNHIVSNIETIAADINARAGHGIGWNSPWMDWKQYVWR